MRKFNWLMGAIVACGIACTADDTSEEDVGSSQEDIRGKSNSVGDPCVGWSQCDDGNMCNGIEACVDGQCAAGTPLNCDDANDCTSDTCNASTGCSNTTHLSAHLCTQQPLGYCHGTACMSGLGNECGGSVNCPPSAFECAVATCVNGYCVDYAKADGTPCGTGMCYQGECN